MEHDEKGCSSCMFWASLKDGFGVCRGAPPTAVYDALLGIGDLGQPVWPRTHGEDDWCGFIASKHETSPMPTAKRLKDELLLSVKAANFLHWLGAEKVEDVTRLTEKDLLMQRGCGVKTITEIKEALRKRGLSLAE